MSIDPKSLRVLVADDQQDVAGTLCRPMHKAGFRLRYVPDGQSAYESIAGEVFDLILVDLKMPPGDWGGLWLLRKLRDEGIGIPAVVLSGEGSKQQVIDALRLGAIDWILKDNAHKELLDRSIELLEGRLAASSEAGINQLPSPLAHKLAHFERATDHEKRTLSGLHMVEAVFRFAAAVGFGCTVPRQLPTLTLERLAAPSMGIWFEICTALMDGGAGDPFVRLFSCLVPEQVERNQIRELISLRNNIMHGRNTPTASDALKLEATIRRFVNRANSLWRFELAVPTSMTFNGISYFTQVDILRGAGRPAQSELCGTEPLVTGKVYLSTADAPPILLEPWLVAEVGKSEPDTRCFQFDGLQRSRAAGSAFPSVRYAKTDGGDDGPLSTASTIDSSSIESWTLRQQ